MNIMCEYTVDIILSLCFQSEPAGMVFVHVADFFLGKLSVFHV